MRARLLDLDQVPGATLARLVGDSLFATRGFVELWRALGGRAVAWAVEAEGGIAALLPAVEFGHGPLARLASLPDGLSAGLLVDPALERDRAALARVLFEALARRGYGRVDVFDLGGTLPPQAGFASSRGETVLVDISAHDWAPADAKLRSQIRKAVRERIRVERFDWARHHEAFLDLVERTYRRHGIPPRYPAGLYRRLAALAERDPRIHWRWCERDGCAASSHIYFVERGVVHAWQSYFDKRFSFLKPSPYIRWEVCREVARQGVGWLSLGATPPAATGLAYYKRRWGGRRVDVRTLSRRESLGRLADTFAAWAKQRRATLAPAPGGAPTRGAAPEAAVPALETPAGPARLGS